VAKTRSGGYGTNELTSNLRKPWLAAFARAIYPPMPTLNVIPAAILARIQGELFSDGSIVLNIGSGGLSGCGRRVWDGIDQRQCRIIHLDLGPGELVNLVGDAHRIPLASNSVDGVVMQAVLEHLRNPEMAIAEAERVLRPGGSLYVEMPFLQGFHADPHDYQRYTIEGLRARLSSFEELESGLSVGPFSTLAWIVRDGLSSCWSNKWAYAVSRVVVGWIVSPLRFFDVLVRNNRAALRLACEYFYLCKKPNQ